MHQEQEDNDVEEEEEEKGRSVLSLVLGMSEGKL